MGTLKDFHFTIVFFSGVLGFIVAMILFFLNKTFSFASRLFAAFLVCFSLLALNFSLMTTPFFLHHADLWRVVGFASFSFPPLGYLYVRTVLNQSLRLRNRDMLMFVPALMHPLSLIPFFMKPSHERIAFIGEMLADQKKLTLEPETIMPEGFFFALRIFVGVTAASGQFLALSIWRKKQEGKMLLEQQNKDMYRWLFLFSTVMAIFWSFIILETVYHQRPSPNLNTTLIFTCSGAIFFVSLYLLLQPSILYGIKGWRKDAIEPSTAEEEQVSSKKYSLTQEQGSQFKTALEGHFENTLAFRKNGYTLGDLSRELGIPAYQLSAFINQEYAKNFNELINEYRVDHLIRQSQQSDDFGQFTLEALGKEAGFNSRTAFITAVKKRTGKTPSEIFSRRTEKTS